MELSHFEIDDGKIKFSRRWIMSTLKYHTSSTTGYKTSAEISKILEEIESFEEQLSARFNECNKYDTDIDPGYINEILHQMQDQVNFFILACTENKHWAFNPLIA